jgi:hypothetical protein
MNYTKITLGLMACTALSACGGGSGGGGPVVGGPPSSQYYTTPVAQGTVDPLAGAAENAAFVGDTFITDLDGDGATDDIVMAGRQTQPVSAANIRDSRLSVHSFENGQLVDKTAQWFSGTDNVIMGTEPDVQFRDFFKTGKQDMFVSHSTDMQHYGPATFFRNNGSNFTKVSIPTVGIWSHGSDVGDLNNDSYDDIIMLDYGPNSTIALNNTVDGFTTYVDPRGRNGHFKSGGSGVAIGNFMNDGGNNEIIVSDGACPLQYLNVVGCDNANRTKMFSVDFTGGTLTYTFIKDLPSGANAANVDHHVRVVNHDYNEDGNADVIVFSRTSSSWSTELSEIQFLQNDGSGNFTDTTADTLIGYKTDTASTYKPKFFDINGDGKTDILVSGTEFEGNGGGYNSHQFLLKTADNKYIAAHQNILKNFMNDVESIATGNVSGSSVNIFQGDDGNQYLVTWASTSSVSSDTKLTLFMSRLDDSATTISAGTAVTMLQNAWPYLSDAQATQALLDTSTSFAGGNIIDMNRAYQPIGNLAMGGLDLTGSITGFDIGNITGMATDSLGRGYGIDLAQANIVNTGTAMYNSIDTVRNAYTDGEVHFGADSDTQQWTVGNSYYKNGNVDVSMHMTQLNSNPWIGFSGVWGDVKNASIIDNVVTYKQDNVTLKGSVMHVSTNFTPGLITDVSKQTGAWAEASYSDGGFRADVGVHPVMLSGSVTANVPTSIDNTGTTHYTNYKFALPSNINGYIRSQYSTPLKLGKLNVAAAVSQTGQQTTSVEYFFKW